MAAVTGVGGERGSRTRGRKPPPSDETRRRQFLRRFPWAALILAPLAGVMLVMAIGLTWQWLSLGNDGVRASAVVVSAEPVARGPGTVVVEFQDSSGARRQATLVVGARPKAGESVDVVYSSTDPDAVRLDHDLDTAMVLAFFWVMGIGLVITTRQVVRRARRRA